MSDVTVQFYRLTLRGKPVGSHQLRERTRGRTTHLEARLSLRGSLGQETITQLSRCDRDTFVSRGFREITENRTETRRFDLEFDRDLGLVVARRGSRDEATTPYLRPLRDPLSLLHEIRFLPPEREHHRVPMLGKDVVATLSGTVEIDTALGERTARVYHLHPGGSYLLVDSEPPHTILRLTQRLDEHLLDATLIRTDEEDTMTPWSGSGSGRGSGGGSRGGGGQRDDRGSGKRRRRRARRRRKKRDG